MWSLRALSRMDFRTIPLLLGVMMMSLLVISATTCETADRLEESFFTPYVISQIKWFGIGFFVYFFFAALDYQYLRKWSLVLYIVAIVMLLGLFFTAPIQNVQRWYRIPGLGIAFQPSEYAKLFVVIALSWFLEKKTAIIQTRQTTLQAIFIIFIPFILILKQPDLGTALVLFPIGLVMFYFGGMKRKVVMGMSLLALLALGFVSLLFLGILSHEKMRPVLTHVLKEYQYERLNPNTYHQKASQTALALGGVWGSGWRESEFSGKQWLPAAHTDSVFAAFGEEFGLVGVLLLLIFFFGLIYFSFQVTAVAKDRFGRLLSAGITVYLAMHMIVNMGMMCG
ncbi:MAG: FtsW/RodA/SpoVE family cell cycle protein, partial [Chlamydiae bacterium]|nr:FtsW/RodA/SpoVE family cell cycle protein [Chlamydiota bacterium]